MKKSTLFICTAAIFAASCSKKKETETTAVTQTQVINDFVNKVALPQYQDFKDKATVLNTAVGAFNSSPSAANLEAVRTAWRDVRSVWEQCEGFLIGPVSDDNYDPNMDTWPVDHSQLDSFVSNSSSYSTSTIEGLNQALRGFHPLEYILWGQGGNATAASITTKQKQYMVGLAQDILNNVTALHNSWAASGGNFQSKMLTAGNGSTLYPKRVDAMLALVAGMADICEEVAGGKILEPFQQTDSTLTESPFSHNSITDFKNNLIGARNVYICSYNGQSGTSMSAYVAAKNLELDKKIKDQFAAAISALSNVTATFEVGLHTQRPQLQAAMDAISTLQGTLSGDLKTYVQTYGTD